jgi:hypothetical protein
MIEGSQNNEGALIFVNTSTGRFIRRRLSLLDNYTNYNLVGTSDGLLVLAKESPSHTALVVNPFTGSVVRFAAPIPRGGAKVVAVTASNPMRIFGYSHEISIYNEDAFGSVWIASPTRERFSADYFGPSLLDPASMVAYTGHVYMANSDGSILKSATGAGSVVEQLIGASFDVHDTLFGTGFPRTNLVESDGALLLVRRSPGAIEIFKVHDDWRVLEPVSDIGSRALFLGTRCLSVDADMFPSIDGNCVYHMDGFGLSGRMYVRDLNDGTEEVISGAQVPDDGDAYGERRYGHSQATCSHARPQSLPQLLLAHCRVLPRSKCCY